MPCVNFQFHMLLEELLDFVDDVRERYSLSVELEQFFPKVIHKVPLDADLRDEMRNLGHLDRVWLLYRPRRCRKFQRFILNVPTMRGKRLAQGQLGAGTDNPEAFSILKKIASELKRRTTAGIWVITEIGTVGYTKHRVSPGAAKASRAGRVELVSMSFTQSYRVDEPRTK